MTLKSVRDATVESLKMRNAVIVAACGYETRSAASVDLLSQSATTKIGLCYTQWKTAIARPRNDKAFSRAGYELFDCDGDSANGLQAPLDRAVGQAIACNCPVIFDISSMTRSWHGAIVRYLSTLSLGKDISTSFLYIPALFTPPMKRVPPNEFVSPLSGFAALSPPDLPVAAVLGLGYEKERALGLQQLLDPGRTVLLVPKLKRHDEYHPVVLKNNRDILSRVPTEWIFEYRVRQPATTFHLLRAIVDGLEDSYRVVVASLGPKIFGLLCFLLAVNNRRVSVWRLSPGAHGEPRDAKPDLEQAIALDAVWSPPQEARAVRNQ